MRISKDEWSQYDDQKLNDLFRDRLKRWRVRRVAELMEVDIGLVSMWMNGDTIPHRAVMEDFLGNVDVQPPEVIEGATIVMTTDVEALSKQKTQKLAEEKKQRAAESLRDKGLIL